MIASLPKYQMYIGGEWRAARSGAWLESLDPKTAQPWALIPQGGAEDVEAAVAAAHAAFATGPWRRMTASARGAHLRRLADLIARDAQTLAELETRDNGKLIAEMGAQVRYIPQWYTYFGGLADKIEGAVIPIDKPDMFNFTRYEPLGVVAAITAWNSPLLLAAYKLAPALAAGNTVVLKPSEHASVSTLAFARLIEEAGFPAGVVNVVTGTGGEVGTPLVAHPKVAKITFTGSEGTGRRINVTAAEDFKHVTLELGGKSPNIVFADANLDNAVKGAVSGIFAASGQTCVAGSRLLLHRSIHDDFMRRLIALVRTARVGDPLDASTQIGPVTTEAQLHKILDYIAIAKAEGATCVFGGNRFTSPDFPTGWFVEPTIFTDVNNAMRIAREEVFGPVLSVIPFDSEEDAVTIANDSPFGLAAGVWTSDIARALRLSERLEAGTVWINTYRAVSYLSPFGGYKRSGLGRENGQETIKAFLQPKSVWINMAESVPNPFIIR